MSSITSEEPAAKILKTDEGSSESDSHESDEPSGAFSSPWHFSDVVLIVEERRFHVHKGTLSMWSPVFETMFTSDFKEKTALEIPLPGKRAGEVEVLLNLICFKNKQSVTHENFEFLLKLADEYQMEDVKKLCTEFISSILRKTNCLHLFQVVDRFGLNDMKLKCVEEAKSLPMFTIENDTHYADISPEVKVQICTERIKALEEVLYQYYSTCLGLVRDVYRLVAKNDVQCDNYTMHAQGSGLAYNNRKTFVFECDFCQRRLEANWPSDNPTRTMKEPLKKLHLLERKYEETNFGKPIRVSEKCGRSLQQRKHVRK
ncbi:hypothetical protein QZH41_011864 [Actinostola sp. cb2023]|nr:hypothetical protein QZH41_011864 [Actinostola sp. cb2023]